MIQDIKQGPHMDDCPGMECGGERRTIESFEASEVSRNLMTEMRDRIAALETQLAALRADAAEAATILSDLAGDITAAFVREPWLDQPGVGYCELQLGMAEASEYRALAARLAGVKGASGE